MLSLKKVAVTGGLSSGKTSVCNFFKQLHAYVVSADEIVHELLSLKTPLGEQLIGILGRDIVKNEKFDRQLIADKVFNNSELLKNLEKCLYPVVFERIKRHYQEAIELNSPLFIVEIPKLFESGMELFFDIVITVSAQENLALERFQKKGGTHQEYQLRMANQMSPEEKQKRSQYIISNNGDLKDLKSSVIKLFHVLTQAGVAPQ